MVLRIESSRDTKLVIVVTVGRGGLASAGDSVLRGSKFARVRTMQPTAAAVAARRAVQRVQRKEIHHGLWCRALRHHNPQSIAAKDPLEEGRRLAFETLQTKQTGSPQEFVKRGDPGRLSSTLDLDSFETVKYLHLAMMLPSFVYRVIDSRDGRVAAYVLLFAATFGFIVWYLFRLQNAQ
jgi:hypothetical protein